MILGIPIMDNQDELTDYCLNEAKGHATSRLRIEVIQNGNHSGFGKNMGYYYPLIKLFADHPDEQYIGLMHNDVFIYEQGWDQRMEEAFTTDSDLGLIGLVGSNEIDERGGRGGGTVCHFRGADTPFGKGQSQAAGRRITGLEPAACLDSLFMMFRREAIADLIREYDGWDDLPLAHFYDRIWPLRLIENGWHVATMGVECDHLGGMTTVANQQYALDCKRWLDERSLAYGNAETEMYLVAERRYLSEYRDVKQLIPCLIGADYGNRKV